MVDAKFSCRNIRTCQNKKWNVTGSLTKLEEAKNQIHLVTVDLVLKNEAFQMMDCKDTSPNLY